MELKDEISNFQGNYQDNASDIAKVGRAIQKGIVSFASFWGLEEVARALLQKPATKRMSVQDYQNIMNDISARITRLNSIAANKIDEAQKYVDSLSSLGIYLTGAAQSKLASMKAKADKQLVDAKTRAESVSANLSNVASHLEASKPNTDSNYLLHSEASRMEQAASSAKNYLEDLEHVYEKELKQQAK